MNRSLIILLLLLAETLVRAEDFAPFFLKNDDRVVFYGDSITDQRLYTVFTETYVVTRFPELKVSFVHSGWGGDRVSGGGGGPIDTRLKRDVFAYKPTVMTIMLGMNDGSYRAFDQPIFHNFSSGYEHIISEVKKNLPGIRITVIDPSPFDDVTRPPKFEGGYNSVLRKYGDFVKDLATREHLEFADLNTPVVASLEKANRTDSENAAKIVPDRVHPGAAGHLLMAEALLKSWHAPAIVSEVEIDANNGSATVAKNTEITGVKKTSGLTWSQEDKSLPMPVDMGDSIVALAINSSDFVDALDQQILRVKGLSASKYSLKIDGEACGSYSKEDLEKGVNLATVKTPMWKQAMDVHKMTVQHNDLHFTRWRNIELKFPEPESETLKKALADLDSFEGELVKKQKTMARPLPRKFELVPQS